MNNNDDCEQQPIFSPNLTIGKMRNIFMDNNITSQKEQHSLEILDSVRSQDNEKANHVRGFMQKVKRQQKFVIQEQEQCFQGAWVQGSLNIITLIMRFARQLKINNASTKMRLLTHKIYSLINDRASDYSNLEDQQISRRKNQKKKNEFIYQMYESMAYLLTALDKMIPVISINSMFLKFYQISMIIALILNITYIPLGLSFLDDEQSLYFNTIPEYINIIWIFIHANTAYYEEIQIIENRSAILTNYMNNYLLQDLFVILPHLFYPQLGDYQNISLIFKFKQLSSTLKELSESVYIKENIQITIDIVKSVLFQIYIQHLIGCTFHYLGQYQRQNNPGSLNWLDNFGVADLDWQARYVTSIYWSVITSITVGYGDITPKSTIEQLFVTIVALVLCGALGFTINSIGEVLRQLNEKESMYKSKMKAVDMELKKRDLNPVLQLKVKRYYQQMLRLQQSDNSLGEQLMDQLNPQLELDVKIDSYKRFLKRAILLKYFKDETLNKLCSKVKILKFGPGTEVIQSKSQSESLIFLIHGSIRVLASDSAQSVPLKELKPPAVIGEQQFAESGVYNFQMNSIGNTQIGVIERDDFYKVLREDQEELEKFFEIRDKCLYNINQKNLVGETCDICDWTHSYLRCPLAFLQIDQYKVISNACQTVQQQRLPYHHRRMLKYNALKQSANTEDKVYLFKCNLKYESEQYQHILIQLRL